MRRSFNRKRLIRRSRNNNRRMRLRPICSSRWMKKIKGEPKIELTITPRLIFGRRIMRNMMNLRPRKHNKSRQL